MTTEKKLTIVLTAIFIICAFGFLYTFVQPRHMCPVQREYRTANGGEIMKKITIIEPAQGRTIAAKTRVAAYCRVSTGMDDQLVSLETQKSHYENLIGSNPEWEYAGLYYDEGMRYYRRRSPPTS